MLYILTPNAEVILPIVRNMLAINEQLEQTIASLKGLDTCHLTIASFASISRDWLPRPLHEFQKDYPGIEIELLEGGTDDIVQWINDIDMMAHPFIISAVVTDYDVHYARQR